MFSKNTVAVAAFGLFSAASGHVVMNTPEPYGFATLSSSPIGFKSANVPDPNSVFACGGSHGDYQTSSWAPAKGGDNLLVNFTGSAVHGGGVCQFSLNYDEVASDDPSKWHVIHTIIGGCPASAAGNLFEGTATDQYGHAMGNPCPADTMDTATECMRAFNIPIPKEAKNGKAHFAWTWFNKLGNREMYMNCAPIEITGGSDDDTFVNGLPQPFVANAGGSTCKTAEGLLNIPKENQGSSVTMDSTATADLAVAGENSLGSCKAQGNGGSGSGGASSAAPVASAPASTPVASAPVASAPVASTPVASAPVASTPVASAEPSNGGGFAPSASAPVASAPVASAPAASTPVASAPIASSPVVATSAGVAPVPSSTGSPSTGGSGQSCSADGAVVCIGTTQFGLCDHGKVIPQPLAAGTTCSNGVISKRSFRIRGGARL